MPEVKMKFAKARNGDAANIAKKKNPLAKR
jgi:hypothetical protein